MSQKLPVTLRIALTTALAVGVVAMVLILAVFPFVPFIFAIAGAAIAGYGIYVIFRPTQKRVYKKTK